MRIAIAIGLLAVLSGSAAIGQLVTATATDEGAGNTSEFSPVVTAFFATPQNFVVTNTNDSGPGSLRAAVAIANATPGHDNITFAIAGAGQGKRIPF